MQEKLEKINNDWPVLYEDLVKLVLLSLGKRSPSNKLNDEARIILRDSILYRLKCIIYHLELLVYTHDQILEKINEAPNINDQIVKSGQSELTYIFDDIIFNLSSLMDYFGSLVGCIFVGDKRVEQKWKGCVGASRDKKCNAFSKYKIAGLIDKADREWLGQLYNYRSILIHNKKDNTTAHYKIDLNKDSISTTFKVDEPISFTKIVKEYSKNSNVEDASILDVAIWTIDKFWVSFSEFVEAGKLDLEDSSNT